MGSTAEVEVERHPWNTAFEWVDRGGAPGTLTAAQVAAFDRDGYVVVSDLVDGDDLAAAVAETDRFEADVEAGLRRLDGERFSIAEAGAITFSTHLVARSAVLRSLSTHAHILGICADLVGPDVNLYWDQAVYKKPEKPRRFPWHQDNGYAFVEPQQYLTVWLALTDATVDNGCPWVVPGVHRHGTLVHRYVEPRRRRVLVAHAAPDGAEHDDGGAQGVHPPVRTGRRRGPPRRSRRGAADAPGARRRRRPPVPRAPRWSSRRPVAATHHQPAPAAVRRAQAAPARSASRPATSGWPPTLCTQRAM
jgi:hypothetical protein